MRLFFTLFFVLIFDSLYADDINRIELHETKTLDQLVLEQGSENDQEQNVNLENIILENEDLSQIDPDLLVEETDCIIDIVRCEEREYGKYEVLNIREYYKNPDTQKVHVMTVTQFPYVAGSGARFAKGALLGGASPSEAVVIASKCDIRTGGLVTQMSLINIGDIVTVNC